MSSSVTIAGAGGGVEQDQVSQRAWSGLEMASVLSGWYGYNLFNVASFIEYAEPYPKRRKLDKTNKYSEAQVVTIDYSVRESAARIKSHAGVSYRPYISELSRNQETKKAVKRKASSGEEKSVRTRAGSEEVRERDGTTSDCLFPELLCLIFEKLDMQSKGRAAQVHKDCSCSCVCF